MSSPLSDHPPFQRIISDAAGPVDRQWLRMLDDAFANTSFEQLLQAGIPQPMVIEFLGVVALRRRLGDE